MRRYYCAQHFTIYLFLFIYSQYYLLYRSIRIIHFLLQAPPNGSSFIYLLLLLLLSPSTILHYFIYPPYFHFHQIFLSTGNSWVTKSSSTTISSYQFRLATTSRQFEFQLLLTGHIHQIHHFYLLLSLLLCRNNIIIIILLLINIIILSYFQIQFQYYCNKLTTPIVQQLLTAIQQSINLINLAIQFFTNGWPKLQILLSLFLFNRIGNKFVNWVNNQQQQQQPTI